MNSRIVGFILSKTKIKYIPKLNVSLLIEDIQLLSGYLSLYYYGHLNDCMPKESTYSLGFPASQDLLDHNMLITIKGDTVIVENDWLGSIPLFYNSQERIISTFPQVCLQKNKEFDKHGLLNYLKYGFSVYEQTPFKEVQFVPFYSRVNYNQLGIDIVQKEDPVKQVDYFKGASENDIWNAIDNYTHDKEKKVDGLIVIPTSGGFDSKIANFFMHDRSRIRNYTYGISQNQAKSFEVKLAQKYSQKLGHSWQQIYLGKAYELIDQWHDLFAFTTHLHGMYHIEFYQKIKQILGPENHSMVSGICGGVFCGSNQYQKITRPKDLYNLAFTHDLNFKINKKESSFLLEKKFIERYQYMFDDIRLYPIITMRIKLLLLSYSISIPTIMGFPAWTPFLKFDTVMKMMNLPTDRRKNRLWVKEFFASKNLLPRKNMLFQDTKNRLNFHLHNQYSFEPLSQNFSLPYLTEDHKLQINNYLGNIGFKSKLNYTLTTTRIIKEVLKRAGIKNEFSDLLTDYQTLKAIEKSL